MYKYRLFPVLIPVIGMAMYSVCLFTTSCGNMNINISGTSEGTSTGTASPGSVLWQAKLGGSGDEEPHGACLALDGGSVIAVYSFSSDISGTTPYGQQDAYLVHLGPDGSSLWQALAGGLNNDYANSVVQVPGGYVAAGASESGELPGHHGSSDGWVFMVDNDGALTWQSFIGGSDYDQVYALTEDSQENGCIAVGLTDSADIAGCPPHGEQDALIARIYTLNGSTNWVKTLGGNGDDILRGIARGGGLVTPVYVMAGSSASTDIVGCTQYGAGDFWVVATDESGDIKWQTMWGGSGADGAYNVCKSTTGDFYMAGSSMSPDLPGCTAYGSYDGCVAKLDENGNVLWTRLYGGSGMDFTVFVRPTDDGGCLVVGTTDSTDMDGLTLTGTMDYWLMRLDPDGATVWQALYGGENINMCYVAAQNYNDAFIVAGRSNSIIEGTPNYGGDDIWALKIAQ